MPDGWKVRSQVDIRRPDGSRTLKPLEELTDEERKRMFEVWKRNLELAGYRVVEKDEMSLAAGGEK